MSTQAEEGDDGYVEMLLPILWVFFPLEDLDFWSLPTQNLFALEKIVWRLESSTARKRKNEEVSEEEQQSLKIM